eukprot:SAG11_NODE_1778_length_4265_cov_1.686750_1_plen_177_part_00
MAESGLGKSIIGTFGVPSYNSIGDEYMKKIQPDPRYKGRQFQTMPPKKGTAGARTQNTLFEEKFLRIFENEKYTQQRRYNVNFDDPKNAIVNPNGFLSTDNAKRDEFSNTVRTNQWRESLRVRVRHTAKAHTHAHASTGAMPRPPLPPPGHPLWQRRSAVGARLELHAHASVASQF